MKLNADILYENLSETLPAELLGFHTSELNLRRPEFYLDSAEPMLANHLYILPGDQFPRHLKLEKGCVILAQHADTIGPAASTAATRPSPRPTSTDAASSGSARRRTRWPS